MAKDKRTLDLRLKDLIFDLNNRFKGEEILVEYMKWDNKFRVSMRGLTAYVDTYRDSYSVGKIFRSPNKIKSI